MLINVTHCHILWLPIISHLLHPYRSGNRWVCHLCAEYADEHGWSIQVVGEYILSLVIEVLSQAKHKRLQVGVVRATDCDNSSYKSRNASYQHKKLGKPFLISALDCSQLVNGLPQPQHFFISSRKASNAASWSWNWWWNWWHFFCVMMVTFLVLLKCDIVWHNEASRSTKFFISCLSVSSFSWCGLTI